MAPRFSRSTGASVQPVGEIWVAFSQASGETLLLNDESAAVLEFLAQGHSCADEVIDALATDSGVDRSAIAAALADCWPRLVEVGLLREIDGVSDRTR